MNCLRAVLVTTLLSVSGCETDVDDLKVFIAKVKQTTAVNTKPYPEFTSKPTFIYSADMLRSPFQYPRNAGTKVEINETKNELKVAIVSQSDCVQPDFNRGKQPLERFDTEALSMAGIFQSNSKKWALIKSDTGHLFKATVGDRLGLFFGKIDSIQNNSVSFTEILPDGAGCWQEKSAILTVLSKVGKNNV